MLVAAEPTARTRGRQPPAIDPVEHQQPLIKHAITQTLSRCAVVLPAGAELRHSGRFVRLRVERVPSPTASHGGRRYGAHLCTALTVRFQ